MRFFIYPREQFINRAGTIQKPRNILKELNPAKGMPGKKVVEKKGQYRAPGDRKERQMEWSVEKFLTIEFEAQSLR